MYIEEVALTSFSWATGRITTTATAPDFSMAALAFASSWTASSPMME